MTQIAYPFLTLGQEAIDSTVWEHVREDGKTEPLSTFMEDWDYLQDIRVSRTVTVNQKIAALQLGIPPKYLDLKLFLTVRTGSGSVPRRILETVHVKSSNVSSVYIVNHRVSGTDLSSRLKLDLVLMLNSEPEQHDVLSPKKVSAKVWSNEFNCILEGEEPRFPMETVSFKSLFAGRAEAMAPWYLHWSPGAVDRDFSSAVRLYINSDLQAFHERLLDGDPLVLQSLMGSVMGQVIINTIGMPDIEEMLDCAEDGTIGSYVKRWLALAFPEDTVELIRKKLKYRPGDFHASLLAAASMEGV